jgi:type II secretory pathway pseudopilin PulG
MNINPPHRRIASPHPARRRLDGFTLVELLVVIGLITTMMTMVALLIGNMLDTSRTSATRTTITKVHRMIEERRDGFMRYQLKRGEINAALVKISNYPTSPQLTSRETRRLATIVARKMLYKRAFPQNSADLAPNSANIVNTADNSEYLYWLLTSGTTFGVPSEGDGRFLASELGDTDGDGLIELIDGWGEPLRFYRWPTRLIRPQGLNQTSLSSQDLTRTRFLMGDGNAQRFLQDPDDDPLATFDKWIRNQQQAASRKALEIEFHTPSTWHSPLIISLGSDKLLGLLEPDQTVVFGHLGFPTNQASAIYDNITNLNIPSTGN